MICPECSAPVDPQSPLGMCLACLVRDAIKEAPEEGLFHLENHVVETLLGEGGMGRVYKARQLAPSRHVALKMLPSRHADSAELRARFRTEAEVIASLDHPHILPIFEIGEHDGLPFFTMKLAEGGTLAEAGKGLFGNWGGIAAIMRNVADAVQFAHERGVLHRDLKPGNILFDAANQPFVSDFGLAKLSHAAEALNQTKSFQMLGTPAYLAPEIASSSLKAATISSDVYALGAVLYELLAGQQPHRQESLGSLLQSIIHEEPKQLTKLNAGIPRDLAAIVHRCLEKQPAARYGSAGQVAADLRAWMEGSPVSARAPNSGELALRWVRKRPAITALTSVLVLGSIVGGVMQQRAKTELAQNLEFTRAEQRDAEGLLEFMNVELTRKLKEVGRLDVLEPVGKKSEAYFENRQKRASIAGDEHQRSVNLQSRMFANQAEVAFERAKFPEALAHAEKAAELRPTREAAVYANYWKGRCLLELGPQADGERLLGECVSEIPNLPPSAMTESMLDLTMNLAVKLVDHGKAQDLRNSDVVRLLDYALTLPAASGATQRHRRATKSYVSGKLAESDEAALVHFQTFAREMEDLATIEPQNAIFLTDRMLAWNHLGSTLIKLKRFDEAMAQYRKYCESALQLATQDPTNHLWRRERKLGLACLLYGLLPPDPHADRTLSPEAETALGEYVELTKADLPKALSKRELDDVIRVLHTSVAWLDSAAQPAIYTLLEEYQHRVIRFEETHKNWEILTKTVQRHAESVKSDIETARAVFKRWHADGTKEAREAKASLLALEGGFLDRADHKAEGRQYMEDSRNLRETLVKENPEDSKFRNNLASLYWWLANAHAEAGGLDASATVSRWRSHLTSDEIIQAGIKVGAKLKGIFNPGIFPLVREIQNLAEQEKHTAVEEFTAAWTPKTPGS